MSQSTSATRNDPTGALTAANSSPTGATSVGRKDGETATSVSSETLTRRPSGTPYPGLVPLDRNPILVDTLIAVGLLYLASIPASYVSHRRLQRVAPTATVEDLELEEPEDLQPR